MRKEIFICDECGKEHKMMYSFIINKISSLTKDVCENCIIEEIINQISLLQPETITKIYKRISSDI